MLWLADATAGLMLLLHTGVHKHCITLMQALLMEYACRRCCLSHAAFGGASPSSIALKESTMHANVKTTLKSQLVNQL